MATGAKPWWENGTPHHKDDAIERIRDLCAFVAPNNEELVNLITRYGRTLYMASVKTLKRVEIYTESELEDILGYNMSIDELLSVDKLHLCAELDTTGAVKRTIVVNADNNAAGKSASVEDILGWRITDLNVVVLKPQVHAMVRYLCAL